MHLQSNLKQRKDESPNAHEKQKIIQRKDKNFLQINSLIYLNAIGAKSHIFINLTRFNEDSKLQGAGISTFRVPCHRNVI